MSYNPQLKLFKVMKGDRAVYFNNKGTAKRERNALIAAGTHAVVMRGPDHWRGESFNVSKRTTKRVKRW